MKDELACSVIIPTYNRSKLLGYTLAALARQTLPPERFEVIVVDDGSSDDSRVVAEAYQDVINVRYVYQEDLGFRVAKARNEGILRASAEICVFIDSGVLLHTGSLRAHLLSHERDERAVVCGYVYGFNQDNEDAERISRMVSVDDADASIAAFEASKQFVDVRERFYRKYGDHFGYLPAPWVVFWTCNVSVRRSPVMRVGMFDERYVSWGVEDIDLGYRLYHSGCHFMLNRAASALHYPHEKSFSANAVISSNNYVYFGSKFRDPICDLVARCHFYELNDLAAESHAADCVHEERIGAL